MLRKKKRALSDFYKRFSKEASVIDKWFAIQANATTTSVAHIRELMMHPAFSMHNPNRFRSLLFTFCANNPAAFHQFDGSGYNLWKEQLFAVDAINPQLAARFARLLERWRRYTPVLQNKMARTLIRIKEHHQLSQDVMEIIEKALG